MNDYLIRALAFDGKVRAFSVRTTDTISEAQQRHATWPTASAALGRSMTAGVMMGAMLKGEDKLTVKVEGKGPLGAIVVDSNSKGEVRGYVSQPQTHFDLNEHGKLDVKRAVGTDGMLTIVKDLGMRDFFTGSVPLVSGELGEDFTYYFAASEQVPSSVGLGVLVNPDNTILASGGFIIQLMPGIEDDTISIIEEKLSSMEPVSTLIAKGLSPEELLQEILGKENVQILDKMAVSFECNCSKDRFGTAILALGVDEIQEMIEDDGKAEAQCHFCMETYQYSQQELESYIDEIKS